ncbi:MAG: hypothetical protein M3Q91_19140 [Acidobacteriota bacterium]|nr:hypothetical protein [Acidobacteriota bacterium]
MRILAILSLVLALVACTSSPTRSAGWIEPADAVKAANKDPAYGIRGKCVLPIKAIGNKDGYTFFNSEHDYRDQTALTVAMSDRTAQKVAERLNVPLIELKGRRIVVLGTAKRVRIDFLDDAGRATGKYYYQTHVDVGSATQIEFAE